MKKLILIMTLLMAVQAFAIDVAIVVEDNTSRLTVGVDTLLGDFLVNNLGYTVTYRDIDTVQTHTYWDGAGYDKIIVVGTEDALPSPTGNVDSIAASSIPFMVIGSDMWDEANLGTGKVTQTENTGYIINIGQSHWITKTLQDTISYWAVIGTGSFSIIIPDTGIRNIDVLLVDKDSRADTGAAIMVACEAGDTVFNTGDGRIVVNQRRVFFGSWQYQEYPMDSCHFYTLFARAVCWLDADTLNAGVMEQMCFSGPYDLNWCSVVEYENRTRSYGNYDSNLGYDSGEKQLFCKIDNGALQRAVGNIYRALDVDSAKFTMRYKGTGWEGTAPDSFLSGIVFDPIIRKWQVERKICYHSNTCPNASWQYAWMDTAGGASTSYEWEIGGAKGTTDSRQLAYDTLYIDETNVVGNRYEIAVEPDTLGGRMLDTLLNHGWVSRTVLYERYPTYGADYGEPAFTGPSDNNNRTPRLSIFLGSYSTTEPEPTIAIDAGAYDDDSIVFVGILGQTIASQEVQVTNSAGGALECLSIADDVAWSTIIADNTNTPMSFTMYIPFGQQAVGYRSGTVTVTCADATNSPKTFKIVSLITAATARQAKGAVEIR